MNCISTTPTSTFATNILIHVTILFIFLTVFFIFYISKISKDAIEKEVVDNIENGIKTIENTTVGSKLAGIKELIPANVANKLINKYDTPSQEVIINNQMVNSHAIIISVILVIFIVTIWGILRVSCGQCLPMGRLLKENAVLFLFVGIVEFLFFKFVALKYIPVEPSYIINVAIDKLKKTS